MSEHTKIAWCDSTFNPWIGCTKVSPACANCYAEHSAPARVARAAGRELWGDGNPRQRTSAANWRQPLKWEAEAVRTGVRRKVFCGNLCDWLDPEVPSEWLAELLDLIRRTPHIDWLLPTKRPELWSRRIYDCYTPEVTGENLPLLQWMSDWLCAWEESRGYSLPTHHRGKTAPANVWIGCTVENQEMADERIPELIKIPARGRFLSCEPLLGPVDLNEPRPGPIVDGVYPPWYIQSGIDWVICGGESGPNARPMHSDWVRSLRDQCKTADVPFFFKQWGEWRDFEHGAPDREIDADGNEADAAYSSAKNPAFLARDGQVFYARNALPEGVPCRLMERIGKARAGDLLDGVEHHEFPEGLRHG